MTDTGQILTFKRRSKFNFERFSEIKSSSRPWRIKNAWPVKGVAFVVGASGAAKTFFTIDALLKLASGSKTVWGRKANQCGVALVAAEDPDGCRARVEAWRLAKHRVSDMPFALVGSPVNLLDPDDVDDFKAGLRMEADAMASEGFPLGVVCFDTLSCSIAGADENSGVDMSRVLAVLAEIAAEFDILVVVVAHFGKQGAQAGIRGWSGLTANADGVIELERDKEMPDLRRVVFRKVKNGRDGGELAFRLDEVVLGHDDDGDELTSCVVAFDNGAPKAGRKAPKKSLTPPEQIVFGAVTAVTNSGVTAPFPLGIEGTKPWMKAVTRDAVRERAFATGLADETTNRNTRNVRFNRALEAVCAKGFVRMEGDLLWLI